MAVSPLFRPIDVAPAYQKVADAIEREIVNGRIKPGDLVLIEAMGGGFTWGAVLIRW